MAYHGDDDYDYERARFGRHNYDYVPRRPVMKRTYGRGNRTRRTVETGGESRKDAQHQDLLDDFADLSLENRRLRSRNRSRHPEINVYSAPPRPPRPRGRPSPHHGRTPYSSPPFRPQSSYNSPRLRRPRSRDSGGYTSPSEKDSDDEALSIDVVGDDYHGGYDFKVPKSSKTVTFQDEVQTGASVIAVQPEDQTSAKTAHGASPQINVPMKSLAISHSRWQGSTFERGELGAEISTISPSAEKRTTPFLTWHQLERTTMSFEEFMAASQSVLNIPTKEKRNVTKLLKDVQQKFEKPRDNGRELEANCMSDLFYSDRLSTKPSSSVLFVSFPYFCLETYSATAMSALTAGSPMHPIRPLLQSHFNSTSQARELAQAITSMPSTPKGDCVHIAQLWCLIVDGTTLVTCSPVSLDALCGEVIKQKPAPAIDDIAQIRVSLGRDRSWLIPVTRDTSWPTFLSLFGDQIGDLETEGSSIAFEYNGEAVDRTVWLALRGKAQTSTVEISIKETSLASGGTELQSDQDLDIPSDSIDIIDVSPTEQSQDQAVHRRTAEPEAQALSEAPAHSHPSWSEPAKSLQVFKHAGSTDAVQSLADDLHNTLMLNSRSQERKAYRKAPAAKSSDIEDWLTYNKQESYPDGLTKQVASLLKIKRRVASTMRCLYNFFWPVNFEHPMTDKFWGALHRVLHQEDQFLIDGRSNPKADLAEATSVCKDLQDTIFPIALTLTDEFLGSEEELEPLSDGFSKAWLHLVTAVTLTAETSSSKKPSFPHSMTAIRRHLDAVFESLVTAQRDTAARLHSVDLEDLEICTGESIIALLINKVSRDLMRGGPDIATVYNDYYQSLEFKIGQDPTPRSHQEKLRYFLQEVEAILSTLQNQMSVLDGFQQSLRSAPSESNWNIITSLGESRQSVVIEACKAHLGGRIDKFKGLQKRAEEIGEWHRNEMETNKDRQENAIMVFTIVTIIFLPLSFVASVFGMNTKDVRNMSLNQWAYWAAGIPLSVVVIVGSLWWAGEFEGFGTWLARTMSRSKKSKGYEKISEPGVEADAPRRRSYNPRMPHDGGIEDGYLAPKPRKTWPSKHY